jgi:hypothetical protein
LGQAGRSSARPTRRREDERGTALVEAAIILPLLMLLTFGAIELGIGFSQKGALESISRAGARKGSTLANDASTSAVPGHTADTGIGVLSAQAVISALQTTAVPELNRLVVYRIEGATGTSHGPTSWGGGCAGVNCMVFNATPDGKSFDPSPVSGTWPKSNRDACSVQADRIGVRIEGRFNFLTGLIGSGFINLSASSVLQLEPTSC